MRKSSSASANERTCGEAAGLLAGDVVYLDLNDRDSDGVGTAKKARADNGVGPADADGVCQGPASLGQTVIVVSADPAFNPGFVCRSGQRYVLSSTSGKIALVGDMTNAWYLTDIGYGNLDGTLNLLVNPTGVPMTTTTTSTTTTTTTTTP